MGNSIKKEQWEVIVKCTLTTTHSFLRLRWDRKVTLKEHNTVCTNGQAFHDLDRRFRLMVLLTQTQGIVSTSFVGDSAQDLLFKLPATNSTLAIPVRRSSGNRRVEGIIVLRRVNVQKTEGGAS